MSNSYFFEQLALANAARQRNEWDSDGKIDLTYDALEFLTESGELGEQVKKLIRQTNGLAGNKTDLQKIKEEVGDVMITLDKLLASIERLTGERIDIEECTAMKFDKTSDKYGFKTHWNPDTWVKNPE